MKYISTRTLNSEKIESAQAIKQGLANDGGLFVPDIKQAARNYMGLRLPPDPAKNS